MTSVADIPLLRVTGMLVCALLGYLVSVSAFLLYSLL